MCGISKQPRTIGVEKGQCNCRVASRMIAKQGKNAGRSENDMLIFGCGG